MQSTKARRGQRSCGVWAWPDSESHDKNENEKNSVICMLLNYWEEDGNGTLVIFAAFRWACGTEAHRQSSLYAQQCNKQLPKTKSTGLSIINHKCKTQHRIAKTANDFLCWSFSQLSGRGCGARRRGKTAVEAISTRYCDFEDYLKECSVTINVGDCWGIKCAVCLSNTVNLNIIQ